jgi:hypothetical protein
MSIITDQLEGIIKYDLLSPEARRKWFHLARDLAFGPRVLPRDPDFVDLDLHAHLAVSTPIRKVLDEAVQRLDVLALVTAEKGHNSGVLSLADAEKKLQKKRIPHERLGPRSIKVWHDGYNELILLTGTEVYVKENQGVLVIGDDGNYSGDHSLSLNDVVHSARFLDALWYLDHPMSLPKAGIGFGLPTDDELKQRRGMFETYRPIVEVSNLQNTLWQFGADVLMQKVANEMGLVGIGNSDTHFNPNDLGKSRTRIPKYIWGEPQTEDDIFRALHHSLRWENNGDIYVENNHASLWSFGPYMAWPTIRKIFGLEGRPYLLER